MATKNNEHAISPVVGVMLMLVVTIIIAAVVSGFAGGVVSGQQKVPQATIQGEYSISNGLQIIHAGGDPLPLSDVVFIIKDGPTFGQNMEERSTQILNMSTIMNSQGTYVQNATDLGFYVSSINPGDTFYMTAANTTCNILQPITAPFDYTSNLASDGYTYTGTKTMFWQLCIRNNNNVGKQFILEVDDKSGHVISSNLVTVSP
jgi:FlaG/FlaF family flagellin (archaellin)